MEQSFTTRTLCHSGISSKSKATKDLTRSLSLFLSFPEWLIPRCFKHSARLARVPGQFSGFGSGHVPRLRKGDWRLLVMGQSFNTQNLIHSAIFSIRKEETDKCVYNPCSPRLCVYLVYQADKESKRLLGNLFEKTWYIIMIQGTCAK